MLYLHDECEVTSEFLHVLTLEFTVERFPWFWPRHVFVKLYLLFPTWYWRIFLSFTCSQCILKSLLRTQMLRRVLWFLNTMHFFVFSHKMCLFFPTLRKFHLRLVHISSLTMYAASTFPFNIFSIQGEILPRCKRGAGDRGTKREDEMEKKEEMRRRSGGGIVQKEEKAHCVSNS